MRWTVDYTRHQTLLICSCGCRVAAPSRTAALRLAYAHDQRAHPNTAQLVADRLRRAGHG